MKTLTKARAGLWLAGSALWLMACVPSLAMEGPVNCGYASLVQVARGLGAPKATLDALAKSAPPKSVVSLAGLASLAERVGLGLEPVMAAPGAVPRLPAVAHCTSNHFVAILSAEGTDFLVFDPSTGQLESRTGAELKAACSGAFLAPAPATDAGWRRLAPEEADQLVGAYVAYWFFDDEGEEDCPTDESGNEPKCPEDACEDCPPGDNAPGDGECRNCADSPNDYTGYAMPVWKVSEPNVNLWLIDRPLFYTTSHDDRVVFKLTYRQRGPAEPANIFGLGPGWDCNWRSFATVTNGQSSARLKSRASSGRYYSLNGALHARSRTTMTRGSGTVGTMVETIQFGRLSYTHPQILSPGSVTNFFLKQRVDRIGRTNVFNYETTAGGITRLVTLIDADGLTNTLRYTNTVYPHLITEVENPFGRKAKFLYDANGRLTNITDMLGLSSSFTYDSEGAITNMATPYGTTSFVPITNDEVSNGVLRALLVTEPNNARRLYFFRGEADRLNPTNYTALLPNSYPAEEVPVTDPFSNLFDNARVSQRNSFYWGRQQFAALSQDFRDHPTEFNRLTTNDYKLARIKHWLWDSNGRVRNCISMLRLPSPDGITEGSRVYYHYDGQDPDLPIEGTNVFPTIVARVLPDTTTQMVHVDRNGWAKPTQIVSTYSTTGTNVLLRTNTISYAANGRDILEVRGNSNELLVGIGSPTDGLPTKFTNALQEVTTVTYDLSHRNITGIAWPSGLVTTNIYFTSGSHSNWLQETKDLDGATVLHRYQFTYDKGLVATFTDPRGLQVTLNWDAIERVTNAVYPNGSYRLIYDKLDLSQFIDRLNHTNQYFFDGVRQLYRQIDPLNRTNDFGYCDCGNPDSITDALGRTVFIDHDFLGRATNVIYPGGYTVANQFDSAGRLKSLSDNAGFRATNGFSNQGLLTVSSNAFGQLLRVTFDHRNRPTNSVDADGVITTNTFDALSRIKTRKVLGTATETFNYSARGLTNYVDPLGTNTFYVLDAGGRVTTITNGNLEITRFAYDAADGLTNLVDGATNTTRWKYDLYGRVTNKVDTLGTNVWFYGYDADDRVTGRTDALGRLTQYGYDAVGNMTNIAYPGFTNRYAFDALNRLTNMVDPVGTTAFTYHNNSLVETEDGPWAMDTVSFGYGTGRQRSSLSLLQPSASPWVQTYLYDSARRLTNTVSPAGAFSYEFMPGVGSASASSSLIKKLGLPGGAYITNSYDTVGRLLSTVLRDSAHATLNSHSYAYNLASERNQQTRFDSSYIDYTYDGIGQLKTAKAKAPGGANRLHEQFQYKYDTAGNLVTRTNNDLVQTFRVNGLNQLTNVTRNAVMTVAGTSTESATSVTVKDNANPAVAANRYGDNTFARTGVPLLDGNNTFTAVGQDSLGRGDTNSVTVKLPASVVLKYDAKGNLTNDVRRIFAYDDDNQLTSVIVTNSASDSTKSEFAYDGLFRRRVRREFTWAGSVWTLAEEVRYLYDGRVVLQERDGNNVPRVAYTRGLDLSGSRQGAGGIGGLLARSDLASFPAQHAFYHADGNGNVTALVNEKQVVAARYLYDPFGNVISMSGPLAEANLYRFSSKEAHPPSGLVYHLYRLYDPNLQRWLSQDPIGEAGGSNLYGFLSANPISRIDPWGLSDDPDDFVELPDLDAGCPTSAAGKESDIQQGVETTHTAIKEFCKEMAWNAAASGAGKAAGAIGGPLLGKLWCKCKGLFGKGKKGLPKPSPKFILPTNPPQLPPSDIPPGWRVREMPPTAQYPDGYWKLEKPMADGSWQPIDPSTMKPGERPQTHVPLPPKAED